MRSNRNINTLFFIQKSLFLFLVFILLSNGLKNNLRKNNDKKIKLIDESSRILASDTPFIELTEKSLVKLQNVIVDKKIQLKESVVSEKIEKLSKSFTSWYDYNLSENTIALINGKAKCANFNMILPNYIPSNPNIIPSTKKFIDYNYFGCNLCYTPNEYDCYINGCNKKFFQVRSLLLYSNLFPYIYNYIYLK